MDFHERVGELAVPLARMRVLLQAKWWAMLWQRGAMLLLEE